MQQLVAIEKPSHWYLRNGDPLYEVPCKSKPGEMRPATLADARKVQAVPSVTTILSVIAKPELEAWKITQAILASLTLPRLQGEKEDAYAKRVAQDAASVSRDAADLGSAVHEYADLYDRTAAIVEDDGTKAIDPRVPGLVGGYAMWRRNHIRNWSDIELPFATQMYGGRIDRIGTALDGAPIIVDLKTQSTTQGHKVRAYESYGLQLAAYAKGKNLGPEYKLWNVIISTTELGRVEIVDWTERREELWRAFHHACELWCILNKYDPRKAVSSGQ